MVPAGEEGKNKIKKEKEKRKKGLCAIYIYFIEYDPTCAYDAECNRSSQASHSFSFPPTAFGCTF